ncbi:MAG TPA: M28 family peptidase [Bacteroidota bacterium]|nr:M28 family peptidase [Bacteroidota bacterium]
MNRLSFTLLMASSLIIGLAGCAKDSPKEATAQQKTSQADAPTPIPSFDGKNAFAYLTAQTDFGPRNPGSNGHINCLSYLQSQFSQYADTVSLQPFTTIGYDGEVLKLTNVFASFNPNATKRVLLIAHWDTRPRADQDPNPKKQNQPILGANDAASGVAVLLEIARLCKATPPPIGLDLLCVDGEDYGKEGDNNFYLLGARYFAKNLPPGYSPQFAILLDMIGDKELEIRKERFSLQNAPDIVNLVWSTAAELGYSQFSDELQGWVTDDHLPFNDAGIKAIDLIDFNYPDTTNRYWHTTQDTPDKCSPQSLEAVGRVITTVVFRQTP